MSIIRFIGVIMFCGSACGLLASPKSDLYSTNQETRAVAAKVLRESYLPPPRTNWDSLVASLKVGASKSNILALLKPVVVRTEGGGGSGTFEAQQFRLDDWWMLECHFDHGFLGCKLFAQALDVWVEPPPNFTGLWTTYRINGQKSYEIRYKDGKRDEEMRSFAGDDTKPKPTIKVAADGFPFGHDTPEGVACDLARAFIKHDAALFTNTCIPPFGASETFGTNYQTFLTNVIQSMKEEAIRKESSPGAPKAITKVFAARHLSTRGPDSLAYAVFDFRGVMFVDLKSIRVNGDDAPYRIFVIKKNDDKWYVYPTPKSDSLLSAGLNSETESTRDFSEAYEVQK